MAKNTKLVLLRLQKQQAKLRQEPVEQAWVARQGVLNFHFCVYGLDGAYCGGFYHGLLQLSEEYPFAPPKLLFFTPSGRFEVNKPICTSFTNYHKQTWASTWNVRTMVLATISFMNSEQAGAGYLGNSYLTRKQLARQSMQFNNRNPLFRQLFKKQLEDYQREKSADELSRRQSQLGDQGQRNGGFGLTQNLKVYGLYVLLGLIIVGWLVLKSA